MDPWRELPTIDDLIYRLDQAYDAHDLVSTRRWFTLLGMVIAIPVVMLIILVLIILGVTNVPQFTSLLLNLPDADDVPIIYQRDDLRLQAFEVSMPDQFTLDLSALNRSSNSAWGGWFGSPDQGYVILIHNDGYFSAEQIGQPPEWRRFHHIRAAEANSLRIHQTADGAQLYINNEYALTLPISSGGAGPALWRSPHLEWQTLTIHVL